MADEVKNLPELSENGKKALEIVEKMTVLELADLVKVMEDRFGVSAAAPVAVAAAPAGASAEEAEEKTIFKVVLKDAGANKIEVIKVVKDATGQGLMEAKQLTEAGGTIKEELPKDQAEALKASLEAAGATVELA